MITEEDFIDVLKTRAIAYRALYIACADLYSMKYPNVTHEYINELAKEYIEEATQMVGKEES